MTGDPDPWWESQLSMGPQVTTTTTLGSAWRGGYSRHPATKTWGWEVGAGSEFFPRGRATGSGTYTGTSFRRQTLKHRYPRTTPPSG